MFSSNAIVHPTSEVAQEPSSHQHTGAGRALSSEELQVVSGGNLLKFVGGIITFLAGTLHPSDAE